MDLVDLDILAMFRWDLEVFVAIVQLSETRNQFLNNNCE